MSLDIMHSVCVHDAKIKKEYVETVRFCSIYIAFLFKNRFYTMDSRFSYLFRGKVKIFVSV